MRIITIIGDDNSGKTTLLQYMLNQLKNTGAEILSFSRLGHNYDDFECILFWKGKKVAMCSIGDAKKYIDEGLHRAKDSNPDYIINVVNTKFEKWYKDSFKKDDIKIVYCTSENYEDQIRKKQEKNIEIISLIDTEN
ncbi:MAG: hypothetical protein SO238_00965 [Treponema sp.]|nr:hypothetical protein [Treponema sp.]